jgi:hypothetical protein
LLRIGYAGDAGAGARHASTAHYKKMYDRASALARIGVWECDLATEALTWTDGVYDLFELPRGAPVDRATPLALYEDDSRRKMEELRARAIEEGGSFTLDVRIRTARGNERWIRLTADVELENGRPVRIFGTKQDITAERSAQEKVQSLQAETSTCREGARWGRWPRPLAMSSTSPWRRSAIMWRARAGRWPSRRSTPSCWKAGSRRSSKAPTGREGSSARFAT